MNIVIPTYGKHYAYNVNFLESFDLYCLDKNDVKINFIVNSNEYELFMNLKNNNINLNIIIIKFSDLLLKIDGENYPDHNEFFNTKYPLQSLKKLLAYTCVDTDYVVFDSENLCIKNFYFCDIFKTLKSKPIIYCDKTYCELQKTVIESTNKLLGINSDNWFFVKSYWFFELEHVNNLINYLRENNNSTITLLLKDTIFFEYQLYSGYLFKYKLKEFINSESFTEKEINFEKLLQDTKNNYEYINVVLTMDNVQYYINILNNLDERIFRLHWTDEEIKDKIINDTNIAIGTFHWD
jgi:hypothetical protein